MDKINQSILQHLRTNSRASWQQIGKQVHLTGQAVAARVQQMQDTGVITGFTIRQDHAPRHFVTVFMEHPNFDAFEAFLKNRAGVVSAHKITGEGCYNIVFSAEVARHATAEEELEAFLNQLLQYGKYKVASSLRCVV